MNTIKKIDLVVFEYIFAFFMELHHIVQHVTH